MLRNTAQRATSAIREAGPSTFVRGKRTKANSAISPAQQRVITQLSVMSASRKQPRLLKLVPEDLIRHQIITRAWSQYQADKRDQLDAQLQKQYESIKEAMNKLAQEDKQLFDFANQKELGKRFPLEMKVPTDFPPRQVWYYKTKKL